MNMLNTDTLKWTAISLIRPYCYMASVDPKDASYSVHIYSEHQK